MIQHDSQIVPALGNTWSHCVTTRILLHSTGISRQLVIAKSPCSPMVELEYEITQAGVLQVGDVLAEVPASGEDAGHFSRIRMGGAYDRVTSRPST